MSGIELAVIDGEGLNVLLRAIVASRWTARIVGRRLPGSAVKDQDIAFAEVIPLSGIELAVVDGHSTDFVRQPIVASSARSRRPGGVVKDNDIAAAIGIPLPGIELAVVGREGFHRLVRSARISA